MASYFGRGVLGTPVMRLGKGPGSLLSRLGSRNDMSCASICFVSSNVVAPVSCLGLPASKIVPDVARSDIVVVWGQNPALAKLEPSPCAELSEADARALGVGEGDAVRVVTPFGEGVHVAHVGGMATGAVHVPHGGGSSFMPAAWRDGSANALTSLDECDEVTGFPLLKTVPCRIERVDARG